MKELILTFSTLGVLVTTPASADDGNQHMMSGEMMAPGLMMPTMNAERGRELFASKGCVVCHSINGVGGEEAPMLDGEFMDEVMNPFEFAARMWRGAAAMVALQEDELGGQIDLTGEELADIIAFVHDAEEQMKFPMSEVPGASEERIDDESEGQHYKEGEEDE